MLPSENAVLQTVDEREYAVREVLARGRANQWLTPFDERKAGFY